LVCKGDHVCHGSPPQYSGRRFTCHRENANEYLFDD
jgi:hypothetical protein